LFACSFCFGIKFITQDKYLRRNKGWAENTRRAMRWSSKEWKKNEGMRRQSRKEKNKIYQGRSEGNKNNEGDKGEV
jgi:hypothetical protein